MGYYLDFIFPPRAKITPQDIVDRFIAAGGTLLVPDETDADYQRDIFHDIAFDLAAPHYLVKVFPRENVKLRGTGPMFAFPGGPNPQNQRA